MVNPLSADIPSSSPSSACVRCGACMAVCPLYDLLGRETVVARGKLNLWDLYQAGGVASKERLREVLECCLLCGACTEKCAVGLAVPDLIKGARAELRVREGWKWSPALVLAYLAWQSPHLLPALAPLAPVINRLKSRVGRESGLAYRLWPHLAWGLQGLPDLSPVPFRSQAPRHLPGRGKVKIAFFVGCGIEAFFPRAGQAFLAICQHLGIEVVIPPDQGCCGLLSESVGERDLARTQGRQMVQEFAALPADFVVSACASCSYQLKRLGVLLDGTPEARAGASLAAKVKEASEFLVQVAGYRPDLRQLPAEVAFHDPCHLHRGQGIIQEPRELLAAATGREASQPRELVCCGQGGAFGVLYPEISRGLGAARTQAHRQKGAQILATSCTGCLVQLRQTADNLQVVHLLELVGPVI